MATRLSMGDSVQFWAEGSFHEGAVTGDLIREGVRWLQVTTEDGDLWLLTTSGTDAERMTADSIGVRSPLTQIVGSSRDSGEQHYGVQCWECGDIPHLTNPQALRQANLLRQRHLAQHLRALSDEMVEAVR